MFVCLYACMYACMYVCMYVCACVCCEEAEVQRPQLWGERHVDFYPCGWRGSEPCRWESYHHLRRVLEPMSRPPGTRPLDPLYAPVVACHATCTCRVILKFVLLCRCLEIASHRFPIPPDGTLVRHSMCVVCIWMGAPGYVSFVSIRPDEADVRVSTGCCGHFGAKNSGDATTQRGPLPPYRRRRGQLVFP